MNNVTKLFSVVMMIIASSILEVRAQSYVTYNHDEAKMNQITVQEIGAGGLPEVSRFKEQAYLSFTGRCRRVATGGRCRFCQSILGEACRD